MPNFKCDAQLHFLTYPQCDVPKEEILRQLKDKYGSKYGWCVISAEDHEERENDSNVGVHRHVMSYCKSRFQTKNARFWDITYQEKTFHPHYEPVKNKPKCLEYVIKDGDYIVDGMHKDVPFTIDVYLQSTKTKQGYNFTFMAKEIQNGKTLDDLDEMIPGQILNHKRKIEDYIQFQQEKKLRQEKKPTFPGFKTPRNYDWELVADWANENFLKKREPRQPQLWLWSRKPAMGKTFPWAILLRKYFTCYEWLYQEKQAKEILTADYILIDELKGGITVTQLKSLSQMYGMNLDIKYGNPTFWNKNVPLIVTSNRPPKEIYAKCSSEDLESLESRFLIVEVDDPCHLEVKEVVDQILVPGTPEPEPEPQPEPDQPSPEDAKDDMEEESVSDSDDSYYAEMEKLRRKNKINK